MEGTRPLLVEIQALTSHTSFGNPRRTEIVPTTEEITLEDLIEEEDVVITVSTTGYIKRTPLATYDAQQRGGKGRIGMRTREEDAVRRLFVASTHDYIMIFTRSGQCHWLKVWEIPPGGRHSRGKPIVNLVNMIPDDEVAAVTVPSLPKAGRRLGILSTLTVPGVSSSATVTSPRRVLIVTAATSSAKSPSATARCARLADSVANASIASRVNS